MGFDWGGFGEGLSVGAQRGLVIGQTLGKLFRDAKYANQQEEINDKYDSQLSQLATDQAQIDALNSGGDVQAATDRARGDTVPIVEAGTREVAAINPETGKWQATADNRTSAQVSEDIYNSTTHIPLQNTENVKPETVKAMVEVAEKNGDFKPTQKAALPNFRGTSYEDEVERIKAEKKAALRRNDEWYFSHDPEKSRQLRKEAEEEDFKEGLRTVYRRALNGDAKAIGILAGSVESSGLLPEGTHIVPNKDGTFALITEDGHVYEDESGSYGNVKLNRQLIDQAFQHYAVTQKAYFDADYTGLAKEQREARKANREDRALDIKENYYNSRVAAAQATAAAKAQGYKAGKWKPNETGTGITLFGTDAQGNEDFPLAVANSDGTNIHPVALDNQWDAMTHEVKKSGFKLGVAPDLTPIVISPDGTQAAAYVEWKDRKAQWGPVVPGSSGAEVPSALPQRASGRVRGLDKVPSRGGVGPEAPEQKRAFNYPSAYEENGMDAQPKGEHEAVQESKPSSAEGEAAPGAVAIPEYEDDMVPQGETDWRRYRDQPAVEPRGYEPGKAPSADRPTPKNAGEVLQNLYDDRVTDMSLVPDWLRRINNADRKRRGLAELPAMDESPKGKSAGEMFDAMNAERFQDHSMVSDQGKRAIAVSKGEEVPERKSALEVLRNRASSEMKARANEREKNPHRTTEVERTTHVSLDKGVAEGPDLRGSQTPYTPKPSPMIKDQPKARPSQKTAATPAAKASTAKGTQKPASAKPAQKATKPAEKELPAPKSFVEGGKVIGKPGDALVKGTNKEKAGVSRLWKRSAKRGARVYAMESGKVEFTGWMRGAGNVVIVSDSKGQNHVYTNVDSELKVGDKVHRGRTVGNAGHQYEDEAVGNYVGYYIDKNPKRA